MALNIFPNDVAEELKAYAEKFSKHCTEELFGSKGEADAAKIEAEQIFDHFKEKSESLLSEKSCEDIKMILSSEASCTANAMNGNLIVAAREKERVKEHCQKLVEGGEVSKELAKNVAEMGWGAAWYAAHTIVGDKDDAVRDKANLAMYFSKIQGPVKVVAMKFIMDEAKILSQKLKIVARERLINNTDVPQAMTISFSVTEGKTTSISRTISFSYGIDASFSVGFFGFATFCFMVSFLFSHGKTINESISTGISKAYTFPISVPARTTYRAQGMVHEAKMHVPYEIVFDFGGAQRSIKGIWKGVAVSEATFEINEETCNMQCCLVRH